MWCEANDVDTNHSWSIIIGAVTVCHSCVPFLVVNLRAGAGKERQVALDEFYEEWKDDSLVILKWLGLQTSSNISGNLQNVQQLLKHPAVNITNPNTCYSVFLGFARSPVNFHAQDGSGYKFMAESTLQVRWLALQPVQNCAVVLRVLCH